MEQKTCPTCERKFTPPSKKKGQKYCCRQCWIDSLDRRVIVLCETCGIEFAVSRSFKETAKHCSWKCRKNQVEKVCATCGSKFYVKSSAADKRNTCSRRCAALLRAKNGSSPRQGQKKTDTERKQISEALKRYHGGDPKKHWNYQGGQFAQRRGPSWQAQRERARQRDGYRCRVCGITESDYGKQLSVHHIISYRRFENSQDANSLSNLVSVCQSCHMKLEHGTASI